ncbi:major facilitator superfamily protein [Microcystis aeruginosa NIES-3806]|uniref:Oxalate/formate antiporter (OxlT-2) n=3 Tax=Microcystis aeruginosa TaxID=1126 RepID=A0A0F6U4G4_MICAE|nr:hypothetical protein [Microcystis aeruginosa]AKE64814.1 oxalate/formate antiporter (OxlT-2) [Microcystis aeruginosa NIES-2549]AOC53211.1 oxalate/formate antiporter (OxlT-2) [Microcystis aeruginosa NIES-2481]GCL48244.1 major facilitator superfamily protein [Microcystis aeruginosa NIES-3787]GCL56152.1 major facilitator superfamily protein [Microcystis aeruginosa NIES-3806]GCL59970.1 major facilitator superfamily protein [Microcystis aeruginosa NIES-3807]
MTTSNYDSELTVLGLPAAKGRWLLIIYQYDETNIDVILYW